MDRNHRTFTQAVAGLALLFTLLFCGVALAQTLSLMAPDIANDNGALKVRFGVTVVEKPILRDELEKGRVMVLKSVIELFKVRDYWMDGSVASATFESTLSFDRLSRAYVLTLPDKQKPITDKSLDVVLKKGWSHIDALLGPWNMLESGQDYSLRLITTMNEKDAPEGFYRFLYFWSWDAGSDNTFHLNFTF